MVFHTCMMPIEGSGCISQLLFCEITRAAITRGLLLIARSLSVGAGARFSSWSLRALYASRSACRIFHGAFLLLANFVWL